MKLKFLVISVGVLLSAYLFFSPNVFDSEKCHSLPDEKFNLSLDSPAHSRSNFEPTSENSEYVIDSEDKEIVIRNLQVPDSIINQMVLLDVKYWGYDSLIHKGQIVINKIVEREVKEIFKELLDARFPIEKVIPVSYYNWDDDASMTNNNSSSFNYRKIKNSTKLSEHSLGLAIDINPKQNPHISRSGHISPPNAEYDITKKGTVSENSICYKVFNKYGWKWGGHWRYSKDYQHFSKSGK